MAEVMKIKIKGTNDAYNVKGNGIITIKITCDNTQLSNVMRMFNLLGGTFTLGAMFEQIEKLGRFSIWDIRVDRDGESRITLRSDSDSVKREALEKLYYDYREETLKFHIVG